MPTVYSPPIETYIALAEIQLTSTTASVTFSSIPQSYRDLVLVGEYAPSANGVLELSYNGSKLNLSRERLFGGSVLGAYADVASDANIGEYKTTDIRNSIIIEIFEYSTTDKNKTTLARSSGLDRAMIYSQTRANTEAVTSLTLNTSGSAVFNVGSTFKLYGIAS